MAQYAGLGLKAANVLIDRHFENIPDRHFKKIPDPVIFPQQTFRNFRRRRSKQGANQQASQNSQRNAEDRSAGKLDRRDYDDDSGTESSYSDGVSSAPNRGVRRHPGQRAYPYPQEAQPPSSNYYNPTHAPPSITQSTQRRIAIPTFQRTIRILLQAHLHGMQTRTTSTSNHILMDSHIEHTRHHSRPQGGRNHRIITAVDREIEITGRRIRGARARQGRQQASPIPFRRPTRAWVLVAWGLWQEGL